MLHMACIKGLGQLLSLCQGRYLASDVYQESPIQTQEKAAMYACIEAL